MSETAKNKGGRPRIDATPITVRIPPDSLSALDEYIENTQDQSISVSRPEMIRRILNEWLKEKGYLPK